MTRDEIQKEWDAFIEYPDGSGKLYVTTASALIFAEVIAKMVATAEREACAKACEEIGGWFEPDSVQRKTAETCSAAIRARGEA